MGKLCCIGVHTAVIMPSTKGRVWIGDWLIKPVMKSDFADRFTRFLSYCKFVTKASSPNFEMNDLPPLYDAAAHCRFTV